MARRASSGAMRAGNGWIVESADNALSYGQVQFPDIAVKRLQYLTGGVVHFHFVRLKRGVNFYPARADDVFHRPEPSH